jgi:hypothetical protein
MRQLHGVPPKFPADVILKSLAIRLSSAERTKLAAVFIMRIRLLSLVCACPLCFATNHSKEYPAQDESEVNHEALLQS